METELAHVVASLTGALAHLMLSRLIFFRAGAMMFSQSQDKQSLGFPSLGPI